MALGFAMVNGHDNSVLVNTVSSTSTAAMVNGLVVYGKVTVHQGMGEMAIKDAFDRMVKGTGFSIKMVDITVKE